MLGGEQGGEKSGSREPRRMWPANAVDEDREDPDPIPAPSTPRAAPVKGSSYVSLWYLFLSSDHKS
ncbi:hypothetical protein P692DRAFT_20830115 [Suillus brevipes Sb2]|nr:hypothetical protein P692DRAFT_20830115 [Suillus brevipes Sb2]